MSSAITQKSTGGQETDERILRVFSKTANKLREWAVNCETNNKQY